MRAFIILSLICLAAAKRQRIVGGSEVSIEDFPWQMSLRTSNSATSLNCGAVLVGATKAFTAAHCVGTANVYLLAGVTDRTQIPAVGSEGYRLTTSITRHPDFVNSGAVGYPNDVATMYWADAMAETGTNIVYAPIAEADDGDFSGAECALSGWGRLTGSGILPTILNAADTSAITNAACAADHWSPAQINDGHICFFTGTTGACNGDSGGPAQCKRAGEDDWTVVGLTSWGRSGCLTDFASVYGRISYFRDWFDAN